MELQWPLILFTTLVAWSAGLFGTQALLAAGGHAKKAQMPAWVASAVLLAAGGIAVFFHLEHWERIFNGFGHITSGITQELIAIVVLAVVAIAYLAMMRRSDDGATVPKWLCWVAVAVCVILVAVMAHSYTMAARPAWDSVLWILYVLGKRVRPRPLHHGAYHGRGRRRDGAGRPAGPRGAPRSEPWPPSPSPPPCRRAPEPSPRSASTSTPRAPRPAWPTRRSSLRPRPRFCGRAPW